MGLIDKFQSDLSKFFNDAAKRGDSLQTQLENSDKSINPFNDESRRGDSLQMQLENSNLSNSTQFQSTRLEDIPIEGVGSFSTNQLENSPTSEVNSFSTPGLDESPTEDVSSVNFFSDDLVAGFTQFMSYPDTLYPGEGLNNSGIVDDFKNPHGLGQHNIDGFVADVQPLSDGFYPNTIELGSVDFFPGGNFSNNFITSTGFTQNADPFGGSKIETEFLMVGEENSLNQDFMSNELFQSVNTLGTYKGAVNFFSDSDSYTLGFTKNIEDIIIPFTQYATNTFYTDQISNPSVPGAPFPSDGFSVTPGIPSPGLSTYSAGLNSQFTSTPETADGDVTWSLKIGAAGLSGEPPYDLDQLKTSLPSMTIGTSEYLGAVNFFSDTDSYTSGFTKDFSVVHDNTIPTDLSLITNYDINKFYEDETLGSSFNLKGFKVTQFVPDEFNSVAGITSYGLSPSIFTTDVEATTTPEFNVYSLGRFQPGGVAGLSYPTDVFDENGALVSEKSPFDKEALIGGMKSWNVPKGDGTNFNIEDFTNFGDNVAGPTRGNYPIGDSHFTFLSGGVRKLTLNAQSVFLVSSSIAQDQITNLPSFNVLKPAESVSSGPVTISNTFGTGDFKLNTSVYLGQSTNEDDDKFKAVEGSIVESAIQGRINSSVKTLQDKFNDGKGTKYRDIKDMDGMAQTEYGTGYADGINNGWMKGLIDSKVPNKEYAGHTSDFFVRESSQGRFVGRILKDLERMTKWQFSTNGLLSLAKNGVMTLFNQSEKSFQLSAPASFATLIGNSFGIRTTSAFGSISGLLQNAFLLKDKNSPLYYEFRVDKKHPKNEGIVANVASFFGADAADPTPRTLRTKYGEPIYKERSMLGAKGDRAHRLYAAGLPDFEEGKYARAKDKINIIEYGAKYPDDGTKDLIKFYFTDVRNSKRIIFRAFLTNIQDSVSPEWNNYRYVGRPDDVYVYKGTQRSISFSMKVAAFSRIEMIPMWQKINYLVGLNYGSYVDTNIYENDQEGLYYQGNPGMTSPICRLTIGDYLTEQTGYIKDFNISVPPDYPWDTIIDDGGKNVIGELPQVVDINMGFQVIPQQVPDSYGKHFGKVGVNSSEVGVDGLGWLPDMLNAKNGVLAGFKEQHKAYLEKTGLSKVEENDEESGTPSNDTPDPNQGKPPAKDLPTD